MSMLHVDYWKPVYADPPVTSTQTTVPSPSTTGDGNQTTPPATGDVTVTTNQDGRPSSELPADKFTDEQQVYIDKVVEKRVAKLKGEQQKTLDQLTQIKRTKDLTEAERGKLQERIDSLESAVMTKEELAAKNKKEADERHQTELQQVTQDRDSWKSRYEVSTIERSILDAASNTADDNPAINPRQIVTELRNKTHLVEKTEDGQSTGEFVPRVKFNGRDSEGKPMTMDLTVSEAVAEMKKMTPEYGNLFKSGLTGGVGSNNTPGTSSPNAASLKSHEAYMKDRQRIKETI